MRVSEPRVASRLDAFSGLCLENVFIFTTVQQQVARNDATNVHLEGVFLGYLVYAPRFLRIVSDQVVSMRTVRNHVEVQRPVTFER